MANKNKRAFYVNGELLREIIRLKGLTQADVYKAIGIGENTIYRVIKFNRMENENDFIKMCEYLDVNPALLKEKEYHFKAKQLFSDGHTQDIDEIITTDNIEEFLADCDFRRSDSELFNSTYIHQFMKNAFGGNDVPEQIEKYLFNKIVETRDIFGILFSEYVLNNSVKDYKDTDGFFVKITVNSDGFYKAFDSWFEENIKNKHLK